MGIIPVLGSSRQQLGCESKHKICSMDYGSKERFYIIESTCHSWSAMCSYRLRAANNVLYYLSPIVSAVQLSKRQVTTGQMHLRCLQLTDINPQALVQSKLGEAYSSICTATFGIAFFGTPHRGSPLARVGEVFAKVVRAALRNPSNTFLAALKKEDLYAAELSSNFQQLQENYRYLNFYETLPLKSFGLVSIHSHICIIILISIKACRQKLSNPRSP